MCTINEYNVVIPLARYMGLERSLPAPAGRPPLRARARLHAGASARAAERTPSCGVRTDRDGKHQTISQSNGLIVNI